MCWWCPPFKEYTRGNSLHGEVPLYETTAGKVTHKSHSLTDVPVFVPASHKLKHTHTHTQTLCIQHLTNRDYLLHI